MGMPPRPPPGQVVSAQPWVDARGLRRRALLALLQLVSLVEDWLAERDAHGGGAAEEGAAHHGYDSAGAPVPRVASSAELASRS